MTRREDNKGKRRTDKNTNIKTFWDIQYPKKLQFAAYGQFVLVFIGAASDYSHCGGNAMQNGGPGNPFMTYFGR